MQHPPHGYGPPPTVQYKQHQMVNLNEGLPYLPALNLPGPVLPYVELIAKRLIEEIQVRAEHTPLRTYLFNVTAANRYANEMFSAMLEQACLTVYSLVMLERRFDMFEDAIQTAIQLTTTRTMAMLYYEDPNLRGQVQLSTRELQALAKAYESMREYQRRVTQTQPPTQTPTMNYPNQPYQQPQPQAGFHHPGAFHPAHPQQGHYPAQYPHQQQYPQPHPGYHPGYGYPPQFRQPFHSAASMHGSPLTSPAQPSQPIYTSHREPSRFANKDFGQSRTPQTQQPVSQFGVGRTHEEPPMLQPNVIPREPHRPQAQSSHQPQPQAWDEKPFGDQPQAQYPQGEPYTLEPIDGPYKWKPSIEQPIMPAWNSLRQIPWLKVYHDGSGRVEIVIEDIPEEKVDYEKHMTSRVLAQERYNRAEAAAREIRATQALKAQELASMEIEVPAHEHIVSEDQTVYTSVEEATVANQIIRASITDTEGNLPVIYTTQTHRLEILPTGSEEGIALIDSIQRAPGYLDIIAKLSEAQVQYEDNPELLALIETVDRRFTHAINDALRLGLQIPGITIDSFMGDYSELLEVIRKQYNEQFEQALMRSHRRVLQRVFGLSVDELKDASETYTVAKRMAATRYGYLPEKEVSEEDIETAFEIMQEHGLKLLLHPLSLTRLELASNELEVDFIDNGSGAIFESSAPLLDKIANSLLDANPKGKVYVITRDHERYELSTSLLNKDFKFIHR